jgi:hypothetical protein
MKRRVWQELGEAGDGMLCTARGLKVEVDGEEVQREEFQYPWHCLLLEGEPW